MAFANAITHPERPFKQRSAKPGHSCDANRHAREAVELFEHWAIFFSLTGYGSGKLAMFYESEEKVYTLFTVHVV